MQTHINFSAHVFWTWQYIFWWHYRFIERTYTEACSTRYTNTNINILIRIGTYENKKKHFMHVMTLLLSFGYRWWHKSYLFIFSSFFFLVNYKIVCKCDFFFFFFIIVAGDWCSIAAQIHTMNMWSVVMGSITIF